MDNKNLNNISELIYKQIIGSITEEEFHELQEWRKSNPKNEETYRRLIDIHFLEKEYHKYKTIEHTRPLEDMKSRIQRERFPKLHIPEHTRSHSGSL